MRKFDGFIKGVNLGGWISQFDKYSTEHFENFITEADIKDIAELGFDHVRVPVDYNVLEDEDANIIESGFGYLKNCLSWCEKYDINMIIDLHECFGYSFDPLKKDMDRRIFFYDEKLQARFLNLWTEIAKRFKDYPDRVAFEPLNEVVLYEVADAWNAVIRKYISTVRAICPDHYIIIGGVRYNNVLSVPMLENPNDDKVAFNFHCYEPLIFTHQGAYWVENMDPDFRVGYPKTVEEYRELSKKMTADLSGAIFSPEATSMGPEFFEQIFAPAIETAKEYNVPLYCGEYGVIDLADNHDKIRWLKDIHSAFDKYGIGHALWNYREKDFGLVDERFASVKDEFIACL
ncbi:MAG: cellulase family glycosylhydrolase [Lachnospiraceae bacterium]|nr:cellulase family glycosylhydrolase [Candidatus Colinaster scatohippi]